MSHTRNNIPPTCTLLLVEGNAADADFIEALLEQIEHEHYRVIQAGSLADAQRHLQEQPIDLVLLGWLLPDSDGVASIRAIQACSDAIPIVVLTETDDDQVALTCIDAGVQDYLTKAELRAVNVRRVISLAIHRLRTAQVHEFQQTLEHMRGLSSAAVQTSTTARLSGNRAVRERQSSAFDVHIHRYGRLLCDYLDHLIVKRDKPREHMDAIIAWLGDRGAGPRDLMDMHVAALDSAVLSEGPARGQALVIEGRLFAIEMMGLLVDYYRVGLRRRFLKEEV